MKKQSLMELDTKTVDYTSIQFIVDKTLIL